MSRSLFSRYNNRQKKYKELKQNPEEYNKFKEYQKQKRRNFVKKNREEHNRKSRKYKQEMRDTAREIGNCTKCFKPKEKDKYKLCLKCREYSREYYKKHNEKK